jgi:hypothetical protein
MRDNERMPYVQKILSTVASFVFGMNGWNS